MNDNLFDINKGKTKDDVKASIEYLTRNMDDMVELMRLDATMKRIKYDSFIAEGFTPEEALLLCR